MGKQRGRLSCWSGETFPALRGRRRMSTQLDQIAAKAKSEPKLRFTSLAHLITPEFLKETWKRSEEHTSELQSPDHLVCRLLLEKKKNYLHLISPPIPLHRT